MSTRSEREKMEALYSEACVGQEPHPITSSEHFYRGFRWGISRSLEALGYSWLDRLRIEEAVTQDARPPGSPPAA